MNAALEKMEQIKTVFLDTQLFYAKHIDMPALIGYLENTAPEFRSIAYESASMAIALTDLEAGSFPAQWVLFANGPACLHKPQVYIGLGWAIAKTGLCFLTAIEKLHAAFYYRIADGCGYYDGSFKRRHTVINKELPAYLPPAALPMYDQGIGRSIWYTEKAAVHNISNRIKTFAPDRHADLWRGVGTAVAYVGGCHDEELETLFQYAASNSYQLTCGAALAARSRAMANTMTADTDRCGRLWFALTANHTHALDLIREHISGITDEEKYADWIKKIEQRLATSFAVVPA